LEHGGVGGVWIEIQKKKSTKEQVKKNGVSVDVSSFQCVSEK
jgi:hypothetical protein